MTQNDMALGVDIEEAHGLMFQFLLCNSTRKQYTQVEQYYSYRLLMSSQSSYWGQAQHLDSVDIGLVLVIQPFESQLLVQDIEQCNTKLGI